MKYLIFLFFLCFLSCQTTQEDKKEDHQIVTDTSEQKNQQKVFLEERDTYKKTIYFNEQDLAVLTNELQNTLQPWWDSIPPKVRNDVRRNTYKIQLTGDVDILDDDTKYPEEKFAKVSEVFAKITGIPEQKFMYQDKKEEMATITIFNPKKKKYFNSKTLYFEKDNQKEISDKTFEELKDFIKNQLSESTKEKIKKGEYKITVIGHANKIGNDLDNVDLSEARTVFIAKYLRGVFQLGENAISIGFFGEDYASDDPDKSRKVVIEVTEK